MYLSNFKQSFDRTLALWDFGKEPKQLTTHVIDSSPNLLLPFFEEGTGVMFLGGKVCGSLVFPQIEIRFLFQTVQ